MDQLRLQFVGGPLDGLELRGQVTLRKRDGSEITLPLEKLSQPDQHRIRCRR